MCILVSHAWPTVRLVLIIKHVMHVILLITSTMLPKNVKNVQPFLIVLTVLLSQTALNVLAMSSMFLLASV